MTILHFIKIWLNAFRVRTLPLAFSCIVLGSLLALNYKQFKWETLFLALLTTLFLQILSNLANDYGDSINGADNDERIGPQRMVHSGKINPVSMRYAIVIFSLLSLNSGIALLYFSLEHWLPLLVFFLMGLTAIVAAIKYTVGKKPYGYQGLGDISVFIFFGLVGVEGSFYLHTGNFLKLALLPAIGVGALAASVLNLNNMRDIKSDEAAGKITLVVRFGFDKAKQYHVILLLIGFCSFFFFSLVHWLDTGVLSPFLHLPIFLFLFFHAKKVWLCTQPKELDAELKKVALSTFLISLLTGVGINL